MNSGSFSFLVKQGIRNIGLNKVMSIASIGILTACLILIGVAVLLSLNLGSIFTGIEQQNELTVYLADNVTDAQIQQVGRDLEALEHVESVTFVSKEEGLTRYKEWKGDSDPYQRLEGENNPIPDSYILALDDIEYTFEVQEAARGMTHVDDVTSARMVVETLIGLRRILYIVGGIIIGILLIASIVVISNTIKLTVFSRRREINIMKYVGATNRFIKLPFKVEGITIGAISAVLSFLVVWGVYIGLDVMLLDSTVTFISSLSGSLVAFKDVWYWLLGGFLLFGMSIGVFGSTSAMRKHLKV